MRRATVTVLASLLWVACSEPPPPMTLRDGSMVRRDATVSRPDAGPGMDAGMDGGRRDAGYDAGPPMMDAGGRDTGTPGVDAGPGDGGMFPSLCGPVGGSPCGAGCGPGLVCVGNGCGDDRCVPSGSPCAVAAHCSASSTCANSVCQGGVPGVTCNDSRDCPLGFSCDGGSCVDRRVACSGDDRFPCPQGYVCYTDGTTHPFCRRMHQRCTPLATDTDGRSAGCVGSGECGALAGTNVCFNAERIESCSVLSDCSFVIGNVCGVNPLDGENRCTQYGLCRAGMGDCAAGFTCVDLWGDGIRECVPELGSCDAATDCSPGSVCAAPWYWGSPRCITSPVPFD